MEILGKVLVGVVAALHLAFGIMEIFLWEKPLGRKIFKTTPEQAEHGAVLAKNQGLYNWFLSAGLVWSLLISDPTQALHTQTFFLICVMLAGIYGAATASRSILIVQALPGLVALVVVWGAKGF